MFSYDNVIGSSYVRNVPFDIKRKKHNQRWWFKLDEETNRRLYYKKKS